MDGEDVSKKTRLLRGDDGLLVKRHARRGRTRKTFGETAGALYFNGE
jgi:hypothetical protein